jgi:hypothetical protein
MSGDARRTICRAGTWPALALLGRAVIGGLIFATIATLIFVPVIFSMMRGKWQPKPRRKTRNCWLRRRLRKGCREKKPGACFAPGGFPGRVSLAATESIRTAASSRPE